MSIYANFAYSAFQAGLAHLQDKHREYTSSYIMAQRCMLLTDAVALVSDFSSCCDGINESNSYNVGRDRKIMVVASLTFALAGTIYISRSMKPAVDLKELLKTSANLNQEQLSSIIVEWSTPLTHHIGVFVHLLRIAFNVITAISLQNRQSLTHLANASFNAFTLHKITKFHWIFFQKTLSATNGSPWPKDSLHSSITNITIQSHLMVRDEPLSSTLTTVHDYFTHFFDNCTPWEKYWVTEWVPMNTHLFNKSTTIFFPVETFRYNITVKPDKPVLPYIDGLYTMVTDNMMGKVNAFLTVV